MIRFQQLRLLGWFFVYLLMMIQWSGEAYAENFWDMRSLPVSQSTSAFFDSNPDIILIWDYQKGDWSVAAKPFSTQAASLSELQTSSASFSQLTTLRAGKSYWLLSTDASSNYSMTSNSSDITSYGPGYHIVSGTGEAVGVFLEKYPEVSQVWEWDKYRKSYSIAEQGEFKEYEGLDQLEILNQGVGYWIKVDHQFSSYDRNSIPKPVKDHASTVDILGNIYSHGGVTAQGTNNELFKYDIRDNSWSVMPSSFVSRSAHSMTYYQNKLYIWGGINSQGLPLDSMEIFDIASEQWQALTTGGHSRYFQSAVLYENKIYYWGGISNEFPFVLNSMDIYDIESGTWSLGTSGGISRAKHQSLVVGDYMYVMGGSAGSFDRYDLKLNEWSYSVGPDIDRQSFSVAYVKNNILLTGGFDTEFNLKKNHSLMALGQEERFTTYTFMKERSSHQSIFFEGKLYSFGGQDAFSNLLDSLEVLVINPLTNRKNNRAPEVSNIEVVGGGSDLTIHFDLLDNEGDFQIEMQLEYSLDQGSTFNPAKGFDNLADAFNPGVSQNLLWKTLNDFNTDESDVMIRLSGKDGISVSTDSTSSELFDVNNGKPHVHNVEITSQPATDKVSVAFSISDVDQDLLNVGLEYSVDSGMNYQSASRISGETVSLVSSNGNVYHLVWHSKQDFFGDMDNVRLRLSVSDENGLSNNYGISEIFSVLNSPNSTPVVLPKHIQSSGGLVEINLDIYDGNSDPIDLTIEYSLDNGVTFSPAQIIPVDTTQNMVPSTNQYLYWDSDLDIVNQDIESVFLKFIPDDGREGPDNSSVEISYSNTFSIYNLNTPPSINQCTNGNPLINGNSGNITISLCGSDIDSDDISLYFEYSLSSDNYTAIPLANLTGDLSELSSGFTTTITWLSSEDVQEAVTSIYLRIRGYDSKEYSAWLTANFSLNNAGQWNPSIDIGYDWSYVAATNDSTHAYFWGGQIDGEDTNQLLRYNLDNSQFISRRSGTEPRIGATLSYVDNKLYAFGGQQQLESCNGSNCRTAVNIMEVYDIASNLWDSPINVGEARTDHTAVVYGDQIYFFGGQGASGLLKSLQSFNTQSLEWNTLTSSPEARYGHSAFEYRGQMFVWGGVLDSDDGNLRSLNSLLVYDFAKDEWKIDTPGGTPRAFHSVLIHNNKAHFWGGFKVAKLAGNFIFFDEEGSVLNTQDIFNLRTRKWTSGLAGGKPRVTHGATNIGNHLIYLGGFDETGSELSSVNTYVATTSTLENSDIFINEIKLEGYRGDISIELSIINTHESVDLGFELSLDSGQTYKSLPSNQFEGTSSNIVTTNRVDLTWYSLMEIRDNQEAVRLRITPQTGHRKKAPALTPVIKIKNDSTNQEPIATGLLVSGLRNDLNISVNLNDPENDPLNLILEYSLDSGNSWQRSVNLTGQLNNLYVPKTHEFTWHSSADISHTTAVMLRVTPSDQGLIAALPTTSTIFTIYNSNTLPYTQIIQVRGERHDLSVEFDSIDTDIAETLSYSFQYSIDGGYSWINSTSTESLLSGSPSMSKTFTWNSLSDIYADQSAVKIRIIPQDSVGEGYAIPSSEFTLNNNNWLTGIGLQRLRRSHTASLFDQKIYYWGGVDEQNKLLNTLDIFDLRKGAWIRGTSGGTARKDHTASIHSGKIYFWGGQGSNGNLSDLDIYDINEDTWLSGVSGGIARNGHSAVVYDYKIYFWGGMGFTNVINSMDIYDISNQSWHEGPSGGSARSEHSAVLNGSQIIHWGGMNSQILFDTMDIYDIENSSWQTGIQGGYARAGHTAILHNDRLIIWGGYAEGATNQVDLYDVSTQIWSQGDSGGTSREQHSAVNFEGKIYYFGGNNEEGFSTPFDVYEIPDFKQKNVQESAENFEIGDNSANLRQAHQAAEYEGKLYVWGGSETILISSLDVYDPVQDHWITTSTDLAIPRRDFVMEEIKGKLIISGGVDATGGLTEDLDIYDINNGVWSKGNFGGVARKNHASVEYNGKLYVWGGEDQNGNLVSSLDIYDAAADNWFQRTSEGTNRKSHCACEFEGRIYFWGGFDQANQMINTFDIYDINSNIWFTGPVVPEPRKNSSCVSFEGKLYFIGGEDEIGETSSKISVYDVDKNIFLNDLNDNVFRRKNASATMLNGKLYLWGGVDTTDLDFIASLDIFQMPRNTGISWSEGQSGGTSRAFHSSVIADGRAVIWGGLTSDGSTNKVDIIDLNNQIYSTSTSGGTSRWNHTATLYEGRVFNWGGQNTNGKVNSMDVFTLPPTGVQWLNGKSLINAREKYGAQSYNGKFYIMGGQDPQGNYLNTTELYNLETKEWSYSSNMLSAKSLFTAVRSGQFIYLWGGVGASGITSDIMIYDTETDTYSHKAYLPEGKYRHSHASVAFGEAPNGKIYTFGGMAGEGFIRNSVDEYTIYTRSFKEMQPFQVSRYGHTASLVGTKIYIWGGETLDSVVLNSLEIYDIDNDSWTSGISGGTPRKYHSTITLGKQLYFLGGRNQQGADLNTVDVYDTETASWQRGVSGGNPRSFHKSLLEEGRIYLIAGNSSGVTSSTDIFIPEVSGDSLSSSIWSNGVTGGRKRRSHSSLSHQDSIYHWGGVDENDQLLNTLDVFNTSDANWSEGVLGGIPRKHHKGFVHQNKLYFHGGEDSSGLTTNSMDIYKADSQIWVKGIRGGKQRKNHSMVEWDGKIYSWAGQDSFGNALNSLDVYNLNTWDRGTEGGNRRTDHNAAVHNGKMYVWNGFGAGNFSSDVNVYDIESGEWLDDLDTPILQDPKSGAASCLMTGPSTITTGVYFWGGDGGQNENRIKIYNIADQTFVTDGPNIAENREYATANCHNGKIYIWGGRPASGIVTNQLDIYDAQLNQLDVGSAQNGGTARFAHTATLHDGKIYIWGGRVSQTGRINQMDIYDINTNTWTTGPNGGTARSDHAAVTFENKIFFYGGSVNTDIQKLDSIDVFDITNNEWQVGPESRLAYDGSVDDAKRAGHTAVLWNGEMFIWGGRDKDEIELNTLDILDLTQWKELSAGGTPRYMHAGIAFEDKLYFWGGTDGGGNFRTMDIYDTRSDDWSSGLEGGQARTGHSAILEQGKIFFWGGESTEGLLNTVDIYELASSSWITGFFGGRGRTNHTANIVGSKIYHWGGINDSGPINTTDIYSITSMDNLWDTIAGPITENGRSGHTATLVDDQIVFWGGEDHNFQLINTVSIFSLEESTWVIGSPGGQARKNHQASYYNGHIYFYGGVNSYGLPISTIDIYDPKNDVWIVEGQIAEGTSRSNHTQLSYLGNKYSWAGENETGNINSLDIYNFDSNSWLSGVSGGKSRRGHSAGIRNGRAYFWGGESYSGKYLNTMDIFDMTTVSNNIPEIISLSFNAMPDILGYRDSVSISCVVSDHDNDLVSLTMEYSIDSGQNWIYIDQGHLDQPTVGIKSLESFTIVWNSISDLPSSQPSVFLRVTPTDGEQSGDSVTIGPAILNNAGNWLPSITGPKAKSKAKFVRRDLTNQLILWGGEDVTRNDSNSQEIFNHVNQTWTTGVPIADFVVEARSEHTSVFFGNYIYHWGGRKNLSYDNTFTVYDAFSDTWLENIATAGGIARASHTANVINSKMYIWGGESANGLSNSLEYYDFSDDQWVALGDGGTPRRGHSSVLYNNQLFFFGGETENNLEISVSDTLDIYNIETGEWSQGISLGTPLTSHVALVEGHRMWVWGGSKGSGLYSNDLYIYDLEANTWIVGLSGGTPRRYHAGAVVDGILYFFGGWNGSHLSTLDRYAISK